MTSRPAVLASFPLSARPKDSSSVGVGVATTRVRVRDPWVPDANRVVWPNEGWDAERSAGGRAASSGGGGAKGVSSRHPGYDKLGV